MKWKTMWDSCVRWGFGPQPPVAEAPQETEGTMDIDSWAIVQTEASHEATVTVDRALSTSPVIISPQTKGLNTNLNGLSLADMTTPGPASFPIQHSFGSSTQDQAVTASVGMDTYHDFDDAAARLLQPVKLQLKKLKATTADSMPPPSNLLKSKSHVQLVKVRLAPIGEHIVACTGTVEEKNRGALVLRLCQHIAKHYWPLDPIPGVPQHLRILEMYHNGIIKRDLQSAISRRPVDSNYDNDRGSGNDLKKQASSDTESDTTTKSAGKNLVDGAIDLASKAWDIVYGKTHDGRLGGRLWKPRSLADETSSAIAAYVDDAIYKDQDTEMALNDDAEHDAIAQVDAPYCHATNIDEEPDEVK